MGSFPNWMRVVTFPVLLFFFPPRAPQGLSSIEVPNKRGAKAKTNAAERPSSKGGGPSLCGTAWSHTHPGPSRLQGNGVLMTVAARSELGGLLFCYIEGVLPSA